MVNHHIYMNEALKEASKAALVGEVPVGAILVCKEKIIARSHNLKEKTKDPTAHAEILAIREATEKLNTYYLNECTLYASLEPCPMCLSAILQSGVKTLVYGARDRKMGAIDSYMKYLEFPYSNSLSVIGGILEEESKKMLQDFFKILR